MPPCARATVGPSWERSWPASTKRCSVGLPSPDRELPSRDSLHSSRTMGSGLPISTLFSLVLYVAGIVRGKMSGPRLCTTSLSNKWFVQAKCILQVFQAVQPSWMLGIDQKGNRTPHRKFGRIYDHTSQCICLACPWILPTSRKAIVFPRKIPSLRRTSNRNGAHLVFIESCNRRHHPSSRRLKFPHLFE